MLTAQEIQARRNLLTEADESMVAAFKALSEINRYRIFRILTDQPAISVGDIAEILGISLPLVSQHIKILTLANVLQKNRKGRKIFPKIKYHNPLVRVVVKAIQPGQTAMIDPP